MIGNLKPIKLIQYATNINNNGDAYDSVQTIYKMWAEVEDTGGGRSQSNGRTEISDTKTFKINFRGYLVTGNYKVVYFGQTYALTSIERVNEKRFNYILTGFNIFESGTTSDNQGGGGNAYPLLNYNSGTPTTATGEYSRFTCDAVQYQIISSHPFTIRWPNGDVLLYQRGDLTCTVYDFNVFGSVNIDIYFTVGVTRFNIIANTGGILAVPNNLPDTIETLSIVGYINNIFDIPTSAKYLQFAFNNISLETADNYMSQLVDNNLTDGTLTIINQVGRYLDVTGLENYETLTDRGWSIT